MRIERLAAESDAGRTAECHEILRAAMAIDDPDGPRMSRRVFEGWLRKGWVGDPKEAWLAVEEDGGVAGWCALELPSRDNKHRCHLDIVVRPGRRREGIGLALLRHAARRAMAADRTLLLLGHVAEGSSGEAFALRLGARPGVAEIPRTLDVGTVPAGRLAELRAKAESAAAGYSLVFWMSPTPEEYLDQVAAINRALFDAPHDPSWQAPVWDAERVRESERRMPIQGVRGYTVAARHDGSGELGGISEVEVDLEQPDQAFQALTAVASAHRGHRLGLLLKVAMMEWLAKTEPQVTRIHTTNAEGNDHMIGINQVLGYRRLGQPFRSWELPVEAAAGAGAQS
jgi:GNAT superfamily N-acetyltransferase